MAKLFKILLFASALSLAACRPSVTLEVTRQDVRTKLSLLACPGCELVEVFPEGSGLTRTVGLDLKHDSDVRELELWLYRAGTGDACDAVKIWYEGTALRLSLEVPPAAGDRLGCSGGRCTVSTDCKVTRPVYACGPDNCPDGCCGANNLCVKQRGDLACGRNKDQCEDCTQSNDLCNLARNRCIGSCRVPGESCAGTSDCCPNPDPQVCDRSVCRKCGSHGYSCSALEPCCEGLACNSGFCGQPGCIDGGLACSYGDKCCTGFHCDGSFCRFCTVEQGSCGSAGLPCCDGLTCNWSKCIPKGICSGYRKSCDTSSSSSICCEPNRCSYDSGSSQYLCQ